MKIGPQFTSNDEQIWLAFKNGDSKAYENIFQSEYAFLLNYGLKLNKDREEIKQCLQILFSELWERRANLGSCNFIRSYLGEQKLRKACLLDISMPFF